MIGSKKGIIDLFYTVEEVKNILGEHERMSVKLKVSEEYKEILKNIKEYIQKENKEIKDKGFEKEIEILDELINYKNKNVSN